MESTSIQKNDLVEGTFEDCGLGYQPDSPHKPLSLVWFYFQNVTKGPQVFYHESQYLHFQSNTFISAAIAFSLAAIKIQTFKNEPTEENKT